MHQQMEETAKHINLFASLFPTISAPSLLYSGHTSSPEAISTAEFVLALIHRVIFHSFFFVVVVFFFWWNTVWLLLSTPAFSDSGSLPTWHTCQLPPLFPISETAPLWMYLACCCQAENQIKDSGGGQRGSAEAKRGGSGFMGAYCGVQNAYLTATPALRKEKSAGSWNGAFRLKSISRFSNVRRFLACFRRFVGI